MELQLEKISLQLKGATDLHLIELINEIGQSDQPMIESYSTDIATGLIAIGEPKEILWSGNADRKKSIEHLICFEASMRWLRYKVTEIELGNH